VSDQKADYINYRLSKAHEALRDAKLLAENNSWNTCINRLYYTCYYAASALLLKNGVSTQTHNGSINQFNLHFIKTGQIDRELGKLYASLMDWRQKGDYGDFFDFNREAVEPLLKPVEGFLNEMIRLIH
jgi:uncharacterized protein (UPF0332 family)